MKRKIAAILAADIAGYSKLVAEDEEETLRRLASYRLVFDDFIQRHDGRIFNTAGDAVLAEFPSAVEAVRCAIDVQESLRTRNLAYPPSRQMSFRMGITIGDVVEREGDLLGDGVNIAARLEGLAEPGGICVSRTVYEQVANKLSVPFSDIGEQQVKNIPNPVHAFLIDMHGDKNAAPRPGGKTAGAGRTAALLPVLGAASAVVVAIGAFAVWQGKTPPAPAVPQQTAAATAPPATGPAKAAPARPAPAKAALTLVPELVPYTSDRNRRLIRDEYMRAPEHKALAIGPTGIGYASGRDNAEAAKTLALETCKRSNPDSPCHIYAVGDAVVSAHARPPVPPQPWLERDATVEQPFDVKALPFVSDTRRGRLAELYVPAKGHKALAVAASGDTAFYHSQATEEEAVRRALERCGVLAGTACRIMAVGDVVVGPLPRTVKVKGFFHPDNVAAISPEARQLLGQRLGSARGGWSAVAIGASGKPGVASKAASETAAIEAAVDDCAKQDRNCRVIAIGPFAVEP